jgi:rare lipoprotein A
MFSGRLIMLIRVLIALFIIGFSTFGSVRHASARSGLAAYHLHTGAMVTAARYEPRGSILRVTNPRNGRSVTVRVNDRGPFNGNRILDLSTGAFRQLFGSLKRGVGPITYTVIKRGASEPSPRRAYRQGRRRSGHRTRSYRRSRRVTKTVKQVSRPKSARWR